MKKKDYGIILITVGFINSILFFLAGIVITALGGGTWEMMQQSKKIMTAAMIDWYGLMAGVLCIVIGTIVYNIYDSKENG